MFFLVPLFLLAVAILVLLGEALEEWMQKLLWLVGLVELPIGARSLALFIILLSAR